MNAIKIIMLLFALPAVAAAVASVSAGWYYQEQQDNNFSAYPYVRVWLKTPIPKDASLRKLYGELPNGVYRLLLENRETLFLFNQPPNGKPARLPVLELPLSEV